MTMHQHPTDEDLILRYYDELSEADAARVDAHVETCAACRAGWTDLGDTLRLVDAADVPDPGHAFEREMWARVSAALPRPRWSYRPLIPLGALAAGIVGLVALSGLWTDEPDTGAPRLAVTDAAGADAHTRNQKRVLLTALDSHFHQTELLLVELMNTSVNGGLEMAFERETADDLVASGRLYRDTARDTGSAEFAVVLEDLERVLVEVARGPARLERAELESLRERIGEEDWLFKVRAAASEVRVRQQHLDVVSEGPL
jgi:hypothetical protein